MGEKQVEMVFSLTLTYLAQQMQAEETYRTSFLPQPRS